MNSNAIRAGRTGVPLRPGLVAVLLCALLLSACGSEDSSSDGGANSASESTESSAATTGAELSPEQQTAVEEYREYAVENADLLVEETDVFLDLVADGDIEAAKEQYPIAHVPFERIEPVAGALGDLDPSLDAREGDVPDNTWGGFHYFEQALWIDEDTSGLEKYIDETSADVRELQELAPELELTPGDIAQGSVDLLGEVSASKITGEEERYSHTDLWDFEANVDGSQVGFEATAPLVDDPALEKQIEQRFDDVYALLDEYREGDGFVDYSTVGKADRRELSQGIDALAEPLSQFAGQVQQG